MRGVLVLYFQPIRFARFVNESMNSGGGASQRSQSLVLVKRIVASGDYNVLNPR